MTNISKKILIVEDDEDFLYIIEKKFTSEGFTIVIAKDGLEGIAVAKKENPDLIFSDVLMPKMDGIEMGKKMRQEKISVPIIFLSNIKDVDYTSKIQKSDNFDFLFKFDTRVNDIIEKAKKVLGIK